MTLNISNLPYEGKRFSERISEHGTINNSMINEECRIFWASPSTSGYGFFDLGAVEQNTDAFQVLSGIIRRYEHDGEKVKIIVEDRSATLLHRDLPNRKNSWLGAGDDVPDKYKNKPIPMVYGHVDRSPLVISNAEITDDGTVVKKMLIDSAAIIGVSDEVTNEYGDGGISFVEYPFYIFEDGYLTLNKYKDQDTSLDQNYTTSGNIIEFLSSLELASGFLSTWQQVPVGKITPMFNSVDGANGVLKYYDSDNPYGSGADGWDGTGNVPDWNKIIDRTGTSFIQIYGTQIIGDNINIINTPYAAFKFDIKLNTSFDSVFNYLIMRVEKGVDNNVAWRYGAIPTIWYDYTQSNNSNNSFEDYANQSLLINNYDTDNVDGYPMIISYLHNNDLASGETYQIGVPANYDSTSGASGGYGNTATVDYRFHEFHVWQNIQVDNLFNRDFYANVKGRLGNPSAPEVINNIISMELGQTPAPNPTGTPYYNWKYAFTINEKINSKKLIEEIASASPFVPRFDSMGNFKFSIIPDDGGTKDHTIKDEDVIDFSFSRSKIEDVYTKVEIDYKWNYGREGFDARVVPVAVGANEDYLNSYNHSAYGLPTGVDGSNESMLHTESTLVIDDISKYIRNKTTAEDFAKWKLLWHCNTHLILKVKIPLSVGLVLEIGDLVEFDKNLGGIKPYGRSYTGYVNPVNSQVAYTTFLITSTNKTLEYVEFSCIQMHDLKASGNIVYGCMDSDACNYDQYATNSDPSLCVYKNEGCTCDETDLGLIDEGCGCGEGIDLGCGCGEAAPSGCDNACGSTLEFDECGVCGGSGIPTGDCDCNGNVEDCAGNCGGTAAEDNCGVCDTDPNNDCVQDCVGDWGGTATMDCGGVCGGDGGWTVACCDGNVYCVGSSVGGTYAAPANSNCADIIAHDECGVCGGDGIPDGECDCNGNVEDECGICGGDGGYPTGTGPNGEDECDCSSLLDSEPHYLDCAGICTTLENGLVLDDCDECGGDNSTCATEGCTDIDACNQNEEATVDDGSCEYPDEGFDCDSNCTADVDNCGVCGGTCVLTECTGCMAVDAVYSQFFFYCNLDMTACNFPVHPGSSSTYYQQTNDDTALAPPGYTGFCPDETSLDEGETIVNENWICNLLPHRCDENGDPIGWWREEPNWDELRYYCNGNPDCDTRTTVGDVETSLYPWVLTGGDCAGYEAPDFWIDNIEFEIFNNPLDTSTIVAKGDANGIYTGGWKFQYNEDMIQFDELGVNFWLHIRHSMGTGDWIRELWITRKAFKGFKNRASGVIEWETDESAEVGSKLRISNDCGDDVGCFDCADPDGLCVNPAGSSLGFWTWDEVGGNFFEELLVSEFDTVYTGAYDDDNNEITEQVCNNCDDDYDRNAVYWRFEYTTKIRETPDEGDWFDYPPISWGGDLSTIIVDNNYCQGFPGDVNNDCAPHLTYNPLTYKFQIPYTALAPLGEYVGCLNVQDVTMISACIIANDCDEKLIHVCTANTFAVEEDGIWFDLNVQDLVVFAGCLVDGDCETLYNPHHCVTDADDVCMD